LKERSWIMMSLVSLHKFIWLLQQVSVLLRWQCLTAPLNLYWRHLSAGYTNNIRRTQTCTPAPWCCKTIFHFSRGVVGLARVGTAFPHLFLTWECIPTPFCTSNVTSRCGSHKITLKHGCDLTDGLATRRFALLVNSLHSETKRSSVEILVGECSLYSSY